MSVYLCCRITFCLLGLLFCVFKSLKERTLAWKKLKLEDEDENGDGGGAEEGEEEEIVEEDPEIDAKEKRNYGKARKFARATQAGEIPDAIKEMYQNASKYSKQPRLFRTELVNRLFKKTSKGEFVLCHEDPAFTSWKRNIDTKFTTADSVGVPYMVILWQTFQGQEHALQEALKRGDIYMKAMVCTITSDSLQAGQKAPLTTCSWMQARWTLTLTSLQA